MTKEEAIMWLIKPTITSTEISVSKAKELEAYDMAIEALQTDIVRCENCKYQGECEEVVLFEVTDDEVMGHHIHWCSYGRSEK